MWYLENCFGDDFPFAASVFFASSGTCEFTWTCPSKPHWNFRAKIFCNNSDDYRCLWDANNKLFIQQCEGYDIQRKGFRKVIEGDITAGDCTPNTYQPRMWTTKGNFDCEFQKSLCNDEGQIAFKDGGGITDRTCGCNHTAGYAFLKKPKNLCFCVPSEEDCTCIKKKCSRYQKVDPEYKCRSIFSWKSWFSCPITPCESIKKACLEKRIDASDEPLKLMNDMAKVPEKETNFKSMACIVVGIGLGLIIIAGFIGILLYTIFSEKEGATMKIQSLEQEQFQERLAKKALEDDLKEKERQHQEDQLRQELKRKALEKDLKEKERQHKERIAEMAALTKKIEIFQHHFDRWEKDNETFIVTSTTEHVISLVENNNIVVVTGSSGSGKSSLIHHVAITFKSQGYAIVPLVESPDDLLQCRDIKKNQLFIIDDFCGKNCVDEIDLKMWKKQTDKIKKLFLPKPSKNQCRLKILVSCHLPIFKDKRFEKSLRLFTENSVDLHSEKYRLLHKEKQQMIEKYNNKIISDEERQKINETLNNCHFEYFPLLCKMSKGKQVDQLTSLLSNPIDSIREDIRNMVQTNPMKNCALVLCLLFPNGFHDDFIVPGKGPRELQKKVTAIIDTYKINPANKSEQLQLCKTFGQLDGTYVKKTGPTYSISHDKLYDIVAVECCQRSEVTRLYIQYASSTLIAEQFRFKTVFQVQEQQLLIYLNENDEAFYFERVFRDLDENIYQSFFKNQQLQEEKYQIKIMNYIHKNKKSCDELFSRLNRNGVRELRKHYLNPKNTYTSTPVIEGAKAGFYQLVGYLIDLKCDLNQTDSYGYSALWYSCKNGMTEVMRVIVEKGAGSLQGDCKGWTPLTAACRWGHMEIVEMLIERTTSLTRCDMRKQFPLTVACRYGHKDVVGLLLDKGVDPSQRDSNEHTPLTAACMWGHGDIVEILIRNNVSLSAYGRDGMSPLMFACKGGHADVVKMLLKSGADPFQKDKRGRTAIYYSTPWGDAISKILKQHISCP